MVRNLSEYETAPGSMPTISRYEGFISECLHVLDSTTAGTAIYILSCLCPEDFSVVIDLVHLDLSQPHQHPPLSEERVHVNSSSCPGMISHLRAYAKTPSPEVYRRVWLELAERWLLTCPMDEEYYKPDETGKDLFCQKLRNDLLDRILNIS